MTSKELLMRKVINCFETGGVNTDYSSIFIYADGPGDKRQVTLGFGITEYGNMNKLLQIYVDMDGKYSDSFKSYLSKIGRTPLVNDSTFKALLIKAAKEDELFRAAEDRIFEEKYFAPAKAFFTTGGFSEPLSLMVILDSYIHSGSIPSFLRSRFPESLPSKGGNEKNWIKEYVDVRHTWLANHSRAILRGTIYRTQFFKNQIKSDNWRLDPPLTANGVKIVG